MFTEETVVTMTDDLTGEVIHHGGWCLMKIESGEQVHAQYLSGIVELILKGAAITPDKPNLSMGDLTRKMLENNGVIGPVVLSTSAEHPCEHGCHIEYHFNRPTVVS